MFASFVGSLFILLVFDGVFFVFMGVLDGFAGFIFVFLSYLTAVCKYKRY
jgi:hypothetical protein